MHQTPGIGEIGGNSRKSRNLFSQAFWDGFRGGEACQRLQDGCGFTFPKYGLISSHGDPLRTIFNIFYVFLSKSGQTVLKKRLPYETLGQADRLKVMAYGSSRYDMFGLKMNLTCKNPFTLRILGKALFFI